MESVGPVDIGDERALPELFPDEQGEAGGPTLCIDAVKQRLSALSTGCGTARCPVHKYGCGLLRVGMKSGP
jgi:hypothetical protein